MKITDKQLRQIIKEEFEQVMLEEDETSIPPHYINIMAMGSDGIRLVIRPDANVEGSGVRIPTGAINNIHPKMNSWMNNMGIHYSEEPEGWHKNLEGVVQRDFYKALKALIDKVDWPDSRIGNYSVEDLKNTEIMHFSNHTGYKRRYSDQEKRQ